VKRGLGLESFRMILMLFWQWTGDESECSSASMSLNTVFLSSVQSSSFNAQCSVHILAVNAQATR
jgi:hypothetical protein